VDKLAYLREPVLWASLRSYFGLQITSITKFTPRNIPASTIHVTGEPANLSNLLNVPNVLLHIVHTIRNTSGNVYLITLFGNLTRHHHFENCCNEWGNISRATRSFHSVDTIYEFDQEWHDWMLLEETLEIDRDLFIAVSVPDSFLNC